MSRFKLSLLIVDLPQRNDPAGYGFMGTSQNSTHETVTRVTDAYVDGTFDEIPDPGIEGRNV
jgi:hypothetical protein